MRILVLSDAYPWVTGGAEVQAAMLARWWARAGHEVTVAGPKNAPCERDGVRYERIPVDAKRRWQRGGEYLLGVARFLRKCRPWDVLYCRFVKEQAAAAVLCRKLGLHAAPVVATPEGAGRTGDVHYLSRLPAARLWLRLVRRETDLLVAISAEVERELLRAGFPPDRILRLGNAVEVPEGVDLGRTRRRPVHVVWAGRLVRYKRPELAVRAVSRARRKGADLRLDLYGDGEARAKVEAEVERLRVAQAVRVRGRVPREILHQAFRAADLFLLTSDYEGMPGVVLEAMAHGLPVIATEVSGIPELVTKASGWVVPPGEADALGEALVEAATIPEERFRAMRRAAQERIFEGFTVDAVGSRLLEAFARLARARRP
ncbi:MAG TPA: glycosyltransferase family 1 protein [Rhodospirillales bacterium]|nr:glycosyltransferase family 1 protein [Rhodospirillales bacterium]